GGEEGLTEEDDETDVDKKVTEFPNADLGSVEKEIERKAAEGEAMVDLAEGAIRVDLPADALLEDEQDIVEAASESVGSLVLPSMVPCAAVSLLLLIH
ncbi:hypothetical protein TSMEX_009280, partial [Taenia solium]